MRTVTTRRVAASCALTLGAVLLSGPTALADTVELPTPEAAKVAQAQLILAVGGRPDRLLASNVPGSVVNDEVVQVGVGGDGVPRSVLVDQRLALLGEGDYAVRERGPARAAVSLSDEPPPVTNRGAVVWQGFSPGRRDLAARLTLDPAIERDRLPLAVVVSFTPTGGRPEPLGAGGQLPGPGTATVTLTNATSQPADLPTATDAPAAALAAPLDRALAVARAPSGARLPSTDDVLPKAVTGTGPARVPATQSLPLHLTGTFRLTGTTGTVAGPATTPTPDGASLSGTLAGGQSVTFTVEAAGAGRLDLDLTAVGALDARSLTPPGGAASWMAWAAAGPAVAERQAALDLLVEVAATGARASSYSPYLGADLVGTGSTTFRYAFAAAPKQVAVVQRLTPRSGPIALACLALLLLLTNGALIWRRS